MMMMSVDPGIVDTNVLVYAVDAEAPQHETARALLESCRDRGTTLYVTSQILCEFYSVVTNPLRVLSARFLDEALRSISAFLALPAAPPSEGWRRV